MPLSIPPPCFADRQPKRVRVSFLAKPWVVTALLFAAFGLLSCNKSGDSGDDAPFPPRHRWVEGRLSVLDGYAPRIPDRALDPSERSEYARIEAMIKRESKGKRTPKSLARLVWLDLYRKRYDKALARLNKATQAGPETPSALNDLAVAHLARASEMGDPTALFSALACLQRALETKPRFLPASFNMAVVLERVHLLEEAIAAWRRYLAMDFTSGWADEARSRMVTLQSLLPKPFSDEERNRLDKAALRGDRARLSQILRAFPGATRAYWEEALLARWAEAESTGDGQEAARSLEIAAKIGEVLAAVNRDRFLEDAVASIKGSGHGAARDALVRGHRLFHKGLGQMSSEYYEGALDSFKGAATLLNGRSPYGALSTFHIARCQYGLGEYEAALKTLRRLAGAVPETHCPILRGRTSWLSGLILLVTGNPTSSLEDYRQARFLLEESAQADLLARVANLMFDNYECLGDRDTAWRFGFEALAGSVALEARERYVIVLKVAIEAVKEGHLSAARYFHNEAVRLAESSATPSRPAQALWWRSRLHALAGRPGPASADLALARSYLERIPAGSREIAILDYLALEAEISLEQDPERAISALREPLARFQEQERRVRLAQLYFLRAQAYRKKGHLDLAERDLLAAIEELESRLGRIAGQAHRVSYLDQERRIFDSMILLQVDHRRDEARAFHISERGRARNLLEFVLEGRAARARGPGTAPLPASPEELTRRLPSGAALVVYALIENRMIAWVVRRDEIRMRVSEADADGLRRTIDAFRDGISRGQGDEALAAALFETLIRPLKADFRKNDLLVFIPDKSLFAIPFAALLDAQTGRLLIEDHALATAPSATLYLRARERDARLAAEPWRALLIGEAPVNQRVFPGLVPTGAEAKRIAGFYANHELLLGERATKACFLELAGQHNLVYFGGHALTNPRSPPFSRLALAAGPGPEDAGALHAHELYRRDFDRTRLVILAACSTAAGRISPSEGAMSLARPFLAGGAPAVIASLWDVDDRGAAEFFTLFHHFLALGHNPMEALRLAQLHGLSEIRPGASRLGDWAAFQLIGGMDHDHGKPKQNL